MNELDRIIKDLSESIEDDQKYMEEEFEAVRDYCIKREFKLSEDEMKTIKSIGLEDWIEEWRSRTFASFRTYLFFRARDILDGFCSICSVFSISLICF